MNRLSATFQAVYRELMDERLDSLLVAAFRFGKAHADDEGKDAKKKAMNRLVKKARDVYKLWAENREWDLEFDEPADPKLNPLYEKSILLGTACEREDDASQVKMMSELWDAAVAYYKLMSE